MAVQIPNIRPISDLRTKLSEIESAARNTGEPIVLARNTGEPIVLARNTGEPIVLVRNGSPSLVVMDSDAYNRRVEQEHHVRKLREAEIEARYQREVVPLSESKNRIDALLGQIAELGGAHG